jgi:hypothetical protein
MDEKYKIFLDSLRALGIVNMFGASPFLQEEYGLSKVEAREVLAEWMSSYKEN